MVPNKMASAVLQRVKVCKHSVRYDSQSEDENVISSVYLLNAAAEILGNPETIQVEITAQE